MLSISAVPAPNMKKLLAVVVVVVVVVVGAATALHLPVLPMDPLSPPNPLQLALHKALTGKSSTLPKRNVEIFSEQRRHLPSSLTVGEVEKVVPFACSYCVMVR